MSREIASVYYSSEFHVLTVVFQDGTVAQERNVESVKEARIILKEKYPPNPPQKDPDKPPVKSYGHLSLC